MKIYKVLLPVLLFALCAAAHAQTRADSMPFGHGEKFRFAVSYKIGFVNADVADVDFNTTVVSQGETEVYNIHAFSTTHPFYKKFFDINDHYTTQLEMNTLLPVKLTAELQEGKYRFSSQYDYDWDDMIVRTRYRNHKTPEYTVQSLPLTANSFDGLSFFYNLRGKDMSKMKKGDSFVVNLVLEDTIRPITYRFAGREIQNVKGLGRFRTLKFVCQLATSEGETFEDGSELHMWISDDPNHIPVYMETPIRIGTIRARLVFAENLKYPMSSKID